MADKIAETKRVRISKAQRVTLAEVLGASLILGVCLVLGIFLIKYIKFNTKIITAKNTAIAEYDQTLRSVGICADTDKNGRLSDAEIAACRPNATSIDDVVNSLRYNIYEVMARNENLESVARQRNENGICYDKSGEVVDFAAMFNLATSDAMRERALSGMKLCSSLRVISDALPDRKNTEALMSSLNQLFIVAEIEPESIAPRDDRVTAEIDDIGVIPVMMRMEGTGVDVIRVLDTIERSIRTFDFSSATVEWLPSGLSLRANANAYYLSANYQPETKWTVRANVDSVYTRSKKVLTDEERKTLQGK